MSRHSKNNTASSFFTYHEKQELGYGTKKQRLGKDSLNTIDSCRLCLQRVQDPLSCHKGHLFCKVCIFNNLLSQKKTLKKSRVLYDKQTKEETARLKDNSNLKEIEEKRRHLDLTELTLPSTTIQDDDPTKASQCYWIPQNQETQKKVLHKPGDTPLCPGGQHPLRLKNLIPVHFTKSREDIHSFSCPICLQTFTNSTKVGVSKKCGHAFCQKCISLMRRDNNLCSVCNQKSFKKLDTLMLQCGGTGFSGQNGSKLYSEKYSPTMN